ncbi:MAG: GDSL-type esterase/lipase family protein [Pirellulales bacterium]
MKHFFFLLAALVLCSAVAAQEKTPDPDQLPLAPGVEQDLRIRGGLAHCGEKFRREKTGLVAYVGGSITNMPGWTQLVDAELQKRFPETKFTFVHAGIPSVDSSGHAFRLVKDVLQKGIPDLLFIEAAVNDLHNGRTPTEQRRGMEGVVRRALRANRNLDIVMLHFAEPRYNDEYAAGKVPMAIANHEQVADHYQVTSIDLAHEVQRRIAAGQFDWKRDFRDLHPSPFGHRLYFLAIRRLFDQAWPAVAAAGDAPSKAAAAPRELPPPLDPFAYDQGELVSPGRTLARERFSEAAKWKPTDKAGTREGFVDVPMWVADGPGAGFSVRFEGRGVGLFFTAGPDTPVLEFRVDQGEWKKRDTFTQWSGGLHLPWVLMLESELESGPHQLDVRIAAEANPKAKGAALRVRDILVNGPAYNLPKMSELKVRSSLDGTEQPSLVWAPATAATQPTPVLVYLHSWSSDYKQDNSPWQAQAVKRGWIYLHPHFRGVNRTPEACGSKLARQDILDALEQIEKDYKVDASRVYLAGTSGGGHMALLMASYFPERFAGVSAWVGISDLADWHAVHVREGRPDHYAQMTRDALGGPPGTSPAVDEQYWERSPRFHLARAAQTPLDIAAGVTDGKTGSVPIRHSLWAFNEVAQARGTPPVSQDEMDQLWQAGRLARPTPEDEADDATFGRAIYLRRKSGPSRVTIFDGGHEGLAPAGCAWLAEQRR